MLTSQESSEVNTVINILWIRKLARSPADKQQRWNLNLGTLVPVLWLLTTVLDHLPKDL